MRQKRIIVLALGALSIVGCAGGGTGSDVDTGPGDVGLLTYATSNPSFDTYVSDSRGLGATNVSNTNTADLFPDVNRATNRVVWSQFIGPTLAVVSDTIPPTGAVPLSTGSINERFPRYSKDGSKIVFVSLRDGHQEVYIMNSDGSGQTRLTNNAEGNGYPAFSPDGSKIVFTSNRDGNAEVYIMNSDGSGQTRLTFTGNSEDFPDFSTDGTKIIYRQSVGGLDMEIHKMDSDGSNGQFIFPIDFLSYPSVGSDNRVYFIKNMSGLDQVCRIDLNGNNFQQMTFTPINKIAPKLN